MTKTTYEDIIEIQKDLVENWGEAGKEIIVACIYEKPFNDSFSTFLKHCTACGGNWGGMLLTGLHELYPNIYELIPNDMGAKAWVCICNLLILLGVYPAEAS